MKLLCIVFLLLFFSSLCASHTENTQKQVYVVCFGGHNENKTTDEIREMHHSYLLRVKEGKEEAISSLLYSYKHSLNGFAALLTASEASKLSALKEVVHVVESHKIEYSLHTTKSWSFLRLEALNTDEATGDEDRFTDGRNMLLNAGYGKNVIVGIIDTGIWPESKSFLDEGMDPVPDPKLWENKCKVDRDSDPFFKCNNKIIAARYYYTDFEQRHGKLDLEHNKLSPRDMNGHGTHVASIVSGRQVKGVASYDGFASGFASGGAPMSRLVIYKVCWRLKKTPFGTDESSFRADDCLTSDILAAIEDAISDGVQVLTFCIGSSVASRGFDLIPMALLGATRKGVVVVSSAGNHGPEVARVRNSAPWVMTVGSSSIDRMFLAHLTLGDLTRIKGQAVTSGKIPMTSLVAGGLVKHERHPEDIKGVCNANSLDHELVRGKIVVCKTDFTDTDTKAIMEVMRAGGVGIIFVNTREEGEELPLVSYPLPTISLTYNAGIKVFDYIDTAKYNARASIGHGVTAKNFEPSPTVAAFSSRGPNRADRHILKPDVIAPGLNILAAWSAESSPIHMIDDHRIVKFNILSGSSASTPHVAAIVILLKAMYMDWTSAAIRSAIMTSASMDNDIDSLITDYDGSDATPFSLGCGHLKPTKAADPGLVYDAQDKDYLLYLCNIRRGFDAFLIGNGFLCPQERRPSYHFNYPSLSISNIIDRVEVPRRVTHVGDRGSTYDFEATSPLGFFVTSTPSTLSFDSYGEEKNFTITVTRDKDAKMDQNQNEQFSFGYYVWKNKYRIVRSPIVIFLE